MALRESDMARALITRRGKRWKSAHARQACDANGLVQAGHGRVANSPAQYLWSADDVLKFCHYVLLGAVILYSHHTIFANQMMIDREQEITRRSAHGSKVRTRMLYQTTECSGVR